MIATLRSSLAAVLIAAVTATSALAGTNCTPDALVGKWTRVGEGNVLKQAVWQFAADGTITCTGSECSRLGGAPVAYLVKKQNIAVAFEKGTMSGTCTVNGAFLLIGGGNSDGGATFYRQ